VLREFLGSCEGEAIAKTGFYRPVTAPKKLGLSMATRNPFILLASPTGFEPVGLQNGPLIPKHLASANNCVDTSKSVVLRHFAAKFSMTFPCPRLLGCISTKWRVEVAELGEEWDSNPLKDVQQRT
jgi:hypothetical protein